MPVALADKIMSVFLLAFLALFSINANAADIKTITKSGTSWDGDAIKYPEGTPEISILRITIKVGETMKFHCHPVPSSAYVASGSLEVELAGGKKQVFKEGDALVEVVNKLHRGHNLSKDKDVELIVFYAGSKEVPNTIEQNNANCSK